MVQKLCRNLLATLRPRKALFIFILTQHAVSMVSRQDKMAAKKEVAEYGKR